MIRILSAMHYPTTRVLPPFPTRRSSDLVTTGRQARVRVQPTTDRRKLKEAAGGLFIDGAGTVLIDGLLEADDRRFKQADDRWPVFVIFTTDGTERRAGADQAACNKWAVG